uniref:BZIP domain-containing protein n=1 Tax=Oryza punctata TaxID=4537 RepID=A0A0E0L433_ORYPU
MIQAMASHAGGSGGGGGRDASSAQRGPIQGLVKQGSLYGLTLNEVQSQLGEPLLSMNLDELLKSVFPDDTDPDSGGGVSGQSQVALGLQRQGSITMPPELSKKTVDEVWKGIQDVPKRGAEEGGRRRRERQPTLGEMTLEDFLVKAGVVTDPNDLPGNMDMVGGAAAAAAADTSDLNAGAQWLQQYHQQALEPQHPSIAAPYMASHLAPQPLAVATGEIADKLVERRQKRMIKNRESAARSRARKQAYTNELENKVSRLKEENERLKKQKPVVVQSLYTPAPAEP